MSTPPDPVGENLPALPPEGASRAQVRAALRPEFREAFDRDYRGALDLAGESPELCGVLDVVEHWRIRAWLTRDPDEHRHVVRLAAELLTDERPPEEEPLAVTEARL